MNFLFPLGMAALGALVPLVVLYILKQRREEYRVPANFLWAQALEDLRANSLFQRLRTPLLLILQALAVLLFALAAAGASLRLNLGDDPRHVIVLLDRSQSMSATDETDGKSRFEVARELAKDAVGSLGGADELMIVGFTDDAEILSGFTTESGRLNDLLDELTPLDRASDPTEAFRLAISYAQASTGFEVEIIVLSDGAFDTELPPVAYPVTYARIGSSADNQGITSARVSRVRGESVQVFVRVDNASVEAVDRTLSLREGGEVVDARAISLGAEEHKTVYFELAEPTGEDPVIVELRLDGKDALPRDDSVELVIRPTVPRNGLLVERAPSLYLTAPALSRLHPGLSVVAVSPEEAEAIFAEGGAGFDLVVFDGVTPSAPPPIAAQIYVGCLPPESGLAQVGTHEQPIVLDWHRTHPVTVRCQFEDVLIEESMELTGTERSLTLVDSTGGPLVLLTPVPGNEVVVVAFPPQKTTVPIRLAWPLFLANSMDHLLANVYREGEEAVAGTGRSIRVQDEGTLSVTPPGGSTVEIEPNLTGTASFADTDLAGVYRVGTNLHEDDPRSFALLQPAEVRIDPAPALQLGNTLVESDAGSISRNVLLRDPLLLLALALLVLEWSIWCGRR